MKRPVESAQRKMRVIAFIASADGQTLSGPGKLEVSMTDTGTGVKTINLDRPFGASTQYVVNVTTATADTVAQVSITDADTFVINTFDCTDGTTAKDAICHVLVIGSDIADQFDA
jgi:hypothetical protein